MIFKAILVKTLSCSQLYSKFGNTRTLFRSWQTYTYLAIGIILKCEMQNTKNNNNRFRKLIPTNSRLQNPTTSQIYSSFQPYNASQPKIQMSSSNQNTSNYHSLQRQSGENLKSLRQRQLLQRRLKTISSAAYEGQKQKNEFSDHNLKRKKERIICDQVQCGKKNQLSNMLGLIAEFKIKTDWIFKSQTIEIQNQNHMNMLGEPDQNFFQEQIYQIVRVTQKSSIRLLAISISRVVNKLKSEVLYYFKTYESHQLEGSGNQEEQGDSYLVSNIGNVIHEHQPRRKGMKARGNMLDVNKFFENK